MEFDEKRIKKEDFEKLVEKFHLESRGHQFVDDVIVLAGNDSETLLIHEPGDREDPTQYGALIWKDKKIAVEYQFSKHYDPLISTWIIKKIAAPLELEMMSDELFNVVIDAVRATIIRPANGLLSDVPMFEYIATPTFH
jgi:hypothetical protein